SEPDRGHVQQVDHTGQSRAQQSSGGACGGGGRAVAVLQSDAQRVHVVDAGTVEDGVLARESFEAASCAAGTPGAALLDGKVAEFAAETVGPAEQLPVEHDACADADLPGDVHEAVGRRILAVQAGRGELGEGGEVEIGRAHV